MKKPNQKITIIGGFERYGSGKYMRAVADSLERHQYEVDRISTNGMRIIGLLKMFLILAKRRSPDVLFQPSISGLSFARDIIILAGLKLIRSDFSLVILSHIFYKNNLFKYALAREWFFKNNFVVSAAEIKEIKEVAAVFNVITPIPSMPFSTARPEKILSKEKILFSYIGYLDDIKGFDRFLSLAEQNLDERFLAIGEPLHFEIKDPLLGRNVEIQKCSPQSKFSERVRLLIARRDCEPVMIYLSRFDLAPTLILELGAARIPICVQNGTDSQKILKNFLPKNAYFSFDLLSEIYAAVRSKEIIECVNKLENFSKEQGAARFEKSIVNHVRRWKNE